MLKNQQHRVQVLTKRFHMNGHTLGFHPQTQKLEKHTIYIYHVKALLKRFHLNGNAIGFGPQTQVRKTCYVNSTM